MQTLVLGIGCYTRSSICDTSIRHSRTVLYDPVCRCVWNAFFCLFISCPKCSFTWRCECCFVFVDLDPGSFLLSCLTRQRQGMQYGASCGLCIEDAVCSRQILMTVAWQVWYLLSSALNNAAISLVVSIHHANIWSAVVWEFLEFYLLCILCLRLFHSCCLTSLAAVCWSWNVWCCSKI